MQGRDSDIKLPPANIEAEEAILGSIMLDTASVHDVSPLIGPADFYRESNGTIYAAILALLDRSEPVDVLAVQAELERRGQLAAVGGIEELIRMVDGIPHAAHAGYYAGLVREKAVARQVIEALSDGLKAAYSHQYTAEELTHWVEARVLAVGMARERHDLTPIGLEIDGVMEDVESPEQARGHYLTTGLAVLDHLIGGFRPGQLIIIAARPSIGKSALALGMAGDGARATGQPVMFHSLEMTGREVATRVLAAESRVGGTKITDPWDLTERDRVALRRARQVYADVPLLIDDAPARTVAGIAALARRQKAKAGLAAIFVDYVQLLTPAAGAGRPNRQELVAQMTRDLKQLAKELAIPVVALSQLNRDVEKREDKRPLMSDMRESGALEQDANIVVLLHRPDFYDPGKMAGKAELIVAKNRGGRKGVALVDYHKGQTRFADPDTDVPDFI